MDNTQYISVAISDSPETEFGVSPEKASSPACTKWAKTVHSAFDRSGRPRLFYEFQEGLWSAPP